MVTVLLNGFLEGSAARLPDKEALICQEQHYTYSELDSLSNRVANALVERGVENGDRVGIFLDNSFESVVSIFGILKAGCAFVVVNPQTKAGKLCYILNNCGAKGLITHWKYRKVLEAVEKNVSAVEFFFVCGADKERWTQEKRRAGLEEILTRQSDRPLGVRAIDIDLAAIIYTSGTTGFPKGASFTHRAMISASTSITTYLENVESDIILNALPLAFDYGLYQLLMSMQMGATLVLQRDFVFPYELVKAITRERVTGFPGVPTIFAMLLQLKNIERQDFSSVRYVTNTAAALPVRHIREIRQVFPKARIYSMYGITECKRVSYMPPEELDDRPTAVGKGMPNEEAYIVNEAGERVGPGEIGELVVRGSNVMMGYWEKPEETAKVLRPGRYPGERVLYTGDLFKMDEDGYLYFVARKDNIIKSRGEKVSPKEVENIIYELPDVLEVSVVGVEDDVLGQVVKAKIVLKNGQDSLTERQVIAHCMQNMERFMVPKYVEFVSSLPKTASGKIMKCEVKPDE